MARTTLILAVAALLAACGANQAETTNADDVDSAGDTGDTADTTPADPAPAEGGDGDTPPPDDGAATDTAAGQSLVEERCASCHGLDRINEGEYDRAGWTEVVDDMIRRGTTLNDEERAAVIDYLATL